MACVDSKYIKQINPNTFRIRFRIYTDNNGVSHFFSKQLSNIELEDAVKYRDEMLQKYKRSSNIKNDVTIKLNDFAEIYFSKVVDGKQSVNTHADKLSKYKNYIEPYLGNKRINDINEEMVEEYVELLKTMKRKDGNGLLSSNTIKHIIHTISAIYQYGIDKKYILDKNNYFRGLTLDSVKKPEIKAYTKEQAKLILKCLKTEDITNNVLFSVMLTTGIRRGEVCGLRFSSITEQDNDIYFITIKKSISQTKRFGIVEKEPKSKKSRKVALSKDVYLLLKEYQKNRELLAKQKKCNFSLDDYIFTNEDLEHLTPSAIGSRWKRFLKKHPEIPKYKLHSLRATFASTLIHSGMDINDLVELMGHSNYRICYDYYIAFRNDVINRNSKIINEIF